MKKLLILSLMASCGMQLCAMEEKRPFKKRKYSTIQESANKKNKLDQQAQELLDQKLLAAVQNSETTADDLLALLEKGANPQSKITCEENDFTIFINAIFTLSCEQVKILIDYGANLNEQVGGHDTTALYFVIMEENDAMAELLISQGATINTAQHFTGATALHCAIQQDCNNLAYKLITMYGANIDAVDNKGNTPLHYAAQENNIEAIHMLFEYGAKLELKNNSKDTPLDEAARCNNYEIVDLLENCIAGDLKFKINSNPQLLIPATNCLYLRLKESVYFNKLLDILRDAAESKKTESLATIIIQLNTLSNQDNDKQRAALCKQVIEHFNKQQRLINNQKELIEYQQQLTNNQQTQTLNQRITNNCTLEYLRWSKLYTIDRRFK